MKRHFLLQDDMQNQSSKYSTASRHKYAQQRHKKWILLENSVKQSTVISVRDAIQYSPTYKWMVSARYSQIWGNYSHISKLG